MLIFVYLPLIEKNPTIVTCGESLPTHGKPLPPSTEMAHYSVWPPAL